VIVGLVIAPRDRKLYRPAVIVDDSVRNRKELDVELRTQFSPMAVMNDEAMLMDEDDNKPPEKMKLLPALESVAELCT